MRGEELVCYHHNYDGIGRVVMITKNNKLLITHNPSIGRCEHGHPPKYDFHHSIVPR